MATSAYPVALDTFASVVSPGTGQYVWDDGTIRNGLIAGSQVLVASNPLLVHSYKTDLQDKAILALETKLGIDSSGVTSSIDYLLRNISSVNPGHHHTVSALNATQRCLIGRVNNSAGVFGEIFPASDATIMRRDDSAATVFGFGTINLAVTGFFVNQLQPTQGGLGNGTWTERSLIFFEGGVFAEDNIGDNQFIYKRTFGANGQLSLGSNHSFGIGTVFNTIGSTYSRGTIFADGSNVVPGASTADVDMTLYVNGAAACPNVSGNYAGAGLSCHTGAGGDNGNADEGFPSEAGSWDIFLADSGAATGENPNNGANGPHFSLNFGKPGASVNADPGGPGFFKINSSKSVSLFNLDDGDGNSGNLAINALTAILGTLSISSQLVVNSAQNAVDNIIRSQHDANLIRTSGTNDTVGIGVASPLAWLEIKSGTTSRAPLKLNTGNLTNGAAILAGSIEFLTDDYYATISTGPAQKKFVLSDTFLTSGFIPIASTNGRLINSTIKTPTAGRFTAQTAAKATVVTLTVGASDASFLISGNINVTTSTAHSFTATCSYTDETNTARVLTLTFSNLAGTLLTSITNVLGAGPYEAIIQQIRAKAGTSITIGTTGTFTTVTYNVEGCITQIA